MTLSGPGSPSDKPPAPPLVPAPLVPAPIAKLKPTTPAAAASAGPSTSPATLSGGSDTIPDRHALLVVDDEIEVTRSLYDLFRLNYDVHTANSGQQALEIVQRRTVHIVLADHRMPGMSGAQLLARIRGLASDAIRLMMTGYADIKVVIDAINRGHVFRYIEKPWDPDELRSLIAQAASQYNLLAERRRLIKSLSTANRRLTRASKVKTSFMELAGHELRTPTTYILGMADALCRLPEDTPLTKIRERLTRIASNARRLALVVDNMLKSATSETFRLELTPESFPVAPLVREVVELFAEFLEDRSLTVLQSFPEDVPELWADRGKLRDVLINLLTNAIRFTPDGGRISFSAERLQSDLVRLRISDTGMGISADDLPHVFEPFYNTSDVSRHSSGGHLEYGKRGAGLGLSIVKRYTEMHGGRVDIQSTLGEGTRFDVFLPLRTSVPTVRSESSEHEPLTDADR